MIISHGRSILKLCTKTRSLLSNTQLNNHVPKKWHGKYMYRKFLPFTEVSKADLRTIDIVGGFFWWWVLWHVFTEYDKFFGPPVPDPEKWTDEELGIPPL